MAPSGRDASGVPSDSSAPTVIFDPEIGIERDANSFVEISLVFEEMFARFPPIPWIDSMPDAYPCRQEIISTYVARALAMDPEAASRVGWPAWRLATRLWLLDLVQGGMPLGDAERLLARLHRRCQTWSGSGVLPPEE